VRRWLNEAAYDAHGHHGHDHDHAHSHHDSRIRAFCLTFDAPLEWMAVNRWLTAVRNERGPDLLRVKGILNLAGEAQPVVIHGVHHVFHPPVSMAGWPDEDRRSRLVFITQDLGREELMAAFERVAMHAG